YSFDQPNPYYDNGVNHINSTNYNSVVASSGSVNQGIRFTTTSAYFQMYSFYQFSIYNSKSWTFAIWICPTSVAAGIIVHMASSSSGCCYYQDVLFLTYGGQIATQVYCSSLGTYPGFYGPVFSINTWTDVASTFSATNGLTLHVNGASVGSTAISTYQISSVPMYATLGYGFGYCEAYVPCVGYQGGMDEFYAYRRELSASEIYSLASA
ncbi:unnamed protein product, partial [Didymodactylos carnosus]